MLSKKILIALVIGLFTVAILAALFYEPTPRKAVPTKPEYVSLSVSRGTFLVEVVRDEASQAQGLSGRTELKDKTGMLFVFPILDIYHFWMKDMNFPLDLVWIRDGRVVGVTENAPPDNSENPKIYPSPELIDTVLEINAGDVKRFQIKSGDEVRIKPKASSFL
jgi:hypothetical protein